MSQSGGEDIRQQQSFRNVSPLEKDVRSKLHQLLQVQASFAIICSPAKTERKKSIQNVLSRFKFVEDTCEFN